MAAKNGLPLLHGASSVADVVKVARALTGKPGREGDDQFVAWLEEQEVASQEDLWALSDWSFKALSQAPGASLVLLDALQQLRREALPRDGISRQNSGCGGFLQRGDSKIGLEPVLQVAAGPPGPDDEQVSVVKGQFIQTEMRGYVGTITMCNDRKRNALSHTMCRELQAGFEHCCAAGARVVILRAQPGVKDPLSRDDAFVQVLSKILDLPVPVLGCIQGSVWGGATDICACCDVLLGTPDVTFAITPSKIGLPYNASGMAHFIQVLPLHVVKWMFFSGLPLTANEALHYGFLNQVVPAEQLTEKAEEMAGVIASRAPLVVQLLKKQVRSICSAPALTPDAFEELHEMRRHVYRSSDMEEGVQAFFEKRVPCFQGV